MSSGTPPISWVSGAPLSRAVISAMSPAEFADHEAEVDRWVAAGAKDGVAAPPLERPAGHVWTRAELASLTPSEWKANEAAIDAAASAGMIDTDGGLSLAAIKARSTT